jgi:hypothetical protein
MFCPKCKAEFVPGVTYCKECETSLVNKLSVETEKENQLTEGLYPEADGLVDLHMSYDENDINEIIKTLESNGINYYIETKIKVSDKDFHNAMEVLGKLKDVKIEEKNSVEEELNCTCPDCSYENEKDANDCERCGAKLRKE